MGDSRDMQHVAQVLDEIRDGMVAAYMAKTGKAREEILADLDEESYMNAASAVERGYADGILYEGDSKDKPAAARYMRARAYAMAVKAVKEHPREAGADPAAAEREAARRREIAARAMGLAADIN